MRDDAPDVAAARKRATLGVIAQSIGRKPHALLQRPDLLWQQLYNRLQWEPDPLPLLLAPELARRSAPESVPWVRTRTPFRESASLLRTLASQSPGDGRPTFHRAATPGGVRCCACSPDGSWHRFREQRPNIAYLGCDERPTASRSCRPHRPRDRLCVQSGWLVHRLGELGPDAQDLDASGGQARATLFGSGDGVQACAVSPDGSFIVSADRKTLRIWDVAGGLQRAVLAGHTEWVSSIAVSPDSGFVASAEPRQHCEDLGSSQRSGMRSSGGHRYGVAACAYSADGSFIVSGSWTER